MPLWFFGPLWPERVFGHFQIPLKLFCCSWSSMFFLILFISWCCTVFRLSMFPDPEALFFSFSKAVMSGIMQGLLLEKHHLVLVGMQCE